MADPEVCHPLWNGFRRANSHTDDLQLSVLKLTALANFNHGAWCKGDRLAEKAQYFTVWLNKQDSAYLEALSEEIAQDRGEEPNPDCVRSE